MLVREVALTVVARGGAVVRDIEPRRLNALVFGPERCGANESKNIASPEYEPVATGEGFARLAGVCFADVVHYLNSRNALRELTCVATGYGLHHGRSGRLPSPPWESSLTARTWCN